MLYFVTVMRHVLLIITILVATPFAITSKPTIDEPKNDYVTREDVQDVISQFSTTNIAAVLSQQRKDPISVSPKQRALVVAELPKEWLDRELHDPSILLNLDRLLDPIFSFYRKHYALFVFRSRTPAIMIESDTVLIFTTGLLENIKNDDELFGLTAHEAAHPFFAQQTANSKSQYREFAIQGKQNNPQALECVRQLAKIELACDAIATLALKQLTYNPVLWLNAIDRIKEAHPTATATPADLDVDFHPSQSIRKSVVQQLTTKDNTNIQPRSAKTLKTLQTLLALSENSRLVIQ